jgi:signal transduction histidine kinase
VSTTTVSGSERPPALGPWWPDVVVGAVLACVMAFASAHIPVTGSERGLDVLGFTLIVVAALALGCARRRPRTVLVVVTAALAVYIVRRYVGGPIYVTGWLALAALSWRTDRRTAVIGGIAAWIVLGSASLLADGDRWIGALVFVGWSAAAVLLGEVLRNRRSARAQLEQRARDLEHSRDEEARRRVAEERLRIARDLHDGVAHAMAVINVQAGAAAHVFDRRPGAAQEALVAIQRASADVLDEMGALLGLLRDDETGPDRTPTPGLAQVPDLVAATGTTVAVTLQMDGEIEQISRPIATAAYRVVQEALTNVLRHSGAQHATVSVATHGVADLAVEIRDDGSGVGGGPSGSGMGLRGMRERVESTAGRFEAAPAPSGGFVVRAVWSGTR